MKNFIEVTEGKQKVLVAVDEILKVIKSKKGYAVIYLKPRLWYGLILWLFMPLETIICTEETYDEVRAALMSAKELTE